MCRIKVKKEWNPHINNLQRKFISMTAGLRIISRKLDKAQMLWVITSQVFSILLYASPVWLTTELSSKNMRKIGSMHYSALRLAVKNIKKSLNRKRIDELTNRMTPRTWMKYSSASMAIKIIRDQTPSVMFSKLMKNAFQEQRWPNFVYKYDSSHNKHGKKGFHNWINFIPKLVKFPWFNLVTLTNDNLMRIRLKDNFGNWKILFQFYFVQYWFDAFDMYSCKNA